MQQDSGRVKLRPSAVVSDDIQFDNVRLRRPHAWLANKGWETKTKSRENRKRKLSILVVLVVWLTIFFLLPATNQKGKGQSSTEFGLYHQSERKKRHVINEIFVYALKFTGYFCHVFN